MIDGPTFKIDMQFGTVYCNSWFEHAPIQGCSSRWIGMGSKTVYDERGNIVSRTEEPTGVVLWIPDDCQRPSLARRIWRTMTSVISSRSRRNRSRSGY